MAGNIEDTFSKAAGRPDFDALIRVARRAITTMARKIANSEMAIKALEASAEAMDNRHIHKQRGYMSAPPRRYPSRAVCPCRNEKQAREMNLQFIAWCEKRGIAPHMEELLL